MSGPVDDRFAPLVEVFTTGLQEANATAEIADRALDQWKRLSAENDVQGTPVSDGSQMLQACSQFQQDQQFFDQTVKSVLGTMDEMLKEVEGPQHRWRLQQQYQVSGRYFPSDQAAVADQLQDRCESLWSCLADLLQFVDSDQFKRVDQQRAQNGLRRGGPAIPHVTSRLAVDEMTKKICRRLTVFLKQPPCTMIIEKSNKEKSDSDRPKNNAAQDKKPSVTVGVLGGDGFRGRLQLVVTDMYVSLNTDLVTTDPLKRKIRYQKSQGNKKYEETLEHLQLDHFKRPQRPGVYKLLYHMVCCITLHIKPSPQSTCSLEHQLQLVSLPMTLHCAANQAQQFIGAYLWHSFTCLDMCNLRAGMVPALPIEDVLRMLNERLLGIGGRGLSKDEKDFLGEKLQAIARDSKSCQDTITLDAFLTHKVSVQYADIHQDPAESQGVPESVKTDFSFWRWFHCALNLLQETVLRPWLDGVIYGFASRAQCERALAEAPDRTFMFRFPESKLPKPSALAQGNLVTVVKKNGKVKFMEGVEAESLKNKGLVYYPKKAKFKHLLGTCCSIEDLAAKYPGTTQLRHYCEWIDSDDSGSVEDRHKLQAKRSLRQDLCPDLIPSTNKQGCHERYSQSPAITLPAEFDLEEILNIINNESSTGDTQVPNSLTTSTNALNAHGVENAVTMELPVEEDHSKALLYGVPLDSMGQSAADIMPCSQQPVFLREDDPMVSGVDDTLSQLAMSWDSASCVPEDSLLVKGPSK